MKIFTLIAGVLALLLLLLSGPLYQADILGLMEAFLAMRIALILGAVALFIILSGIKMATAAHKTATPVADQEIVLRIK